MPPLSDDFPRLPPAAFAAAAAASKQAAASRAASKYERRLGGTGGGVTYDDAVDDPDLEEPDTVVPGGAGYEWREKDPVWDIVTTLARKDAAAEPLLSSYMYMSILSHDTLEQAVSFVLANRLADSTLLPTQLMEIFNSVLFADDADGGLHPIRAAPRHSGDSRARPCVFVLRARAPLPQGFPRPPGAPRATRAVEPRAAPPRVDAAGAHLHRLCHGPPPGGQDGQGHPHRSRNGSGDRRDGGGG